MLSFLQQICKIFLNDLIGCTIISICFNYVCNKMNAVQAERSHLWHFAITAVHAERWRKVANCCNWLYLFWTGVRNMISYGTVPYPGLDFSKFVGSGTLPWCPPIMHILRRIAQKLLWRFLWNCSKQHKSN